MIRAAIQPGTQPQRVKRKVIAILPQPLSYTARGGNKRHNNTLVQLIIVLLYRLNDKSTKK